MVIERGDTEVCCVGSEMVFHWSPQWARLTKIYQRLWWVFDAHDDNQQGIWDTLAYDRQYCLWK